jgi:hypothetical protein|tara:strand:+ start:279 stop:473 length:195 start_codon:yes stop_codon:yes gene_type:complete
MKSKKVKASPAKLLGDIQKAKVGMAVGSMLEGGRIVYGDDKKKNEQKKKKVTKQAISKLLKKVL